MASLRPQEDLSEEQATAAKPSPFRVLAVIDGSERTGRVVEYALNLAQRAREAEVVLLGVVPEPPDKRLRGYGSFKRDEVHARLQDVLGRRALAAAARRFDYAGVAHIDRIEVGEPAQTILRVASEEGCDVILIGNACAGAFRRWLPKVIGLSVATLASVVADLASVPVIVVK